MGVENPLYHTISVDVVGPWNVSQFQGARGRNSRFKLFGLFGLFICDLATSLTNVILMDAATKSDVIKALGTFAATKRLLQNVVTDAGPQLKNLEGKPLFIAISESGITMKPGVPKNRSEVKYLTDLVEIFNLK